MKRVLFISSICLLLAGCEKTDINGLVEQDSFRIYLCNADTKTTNDGLSTKWKEGDKLMVYYAEAGSTSYIKAGLFTITDADTGEATPKTTPSLTKGKKYDWYVFYNYSLVGKVGQTVSTIACNAENDNETQNGNNSMSHLAGTKYPICGITKSVSSEQFPQVKMQNIATVLEFVLENKANKSVVVKKIEVSTIGKDLIGTFKINYSSWPVKMTSGTTVSTVPLIVENGEEIAIGNSASFFVGTAPFTLQAEEPLIVGVEVSNGESTATHTFVYEAESEISFASGKIRMINLSFSKIF